MDIRKAIRRMAGSGLAVLTAIALLGTTLVAQTAFADDKTYDLWFGDSQMYGQGIKDANTRQTKRFSRLVSDADNATDVNVAVSGTNWTGNTSNRFGNQINKLIANYSGKNVRRVIGQGVHNDAKEKPSISAKSTDAELKAKAQAIADTAQPYYTKLRTAFPNAQIAYIPQVTVWGTFQKNNAFFAAVLKMGAYLADDLKQQGWTVMDMQTDLDLIGDHQDYLADIIHVNEKGHAAAAQGIIKWLDTTDVPVSSDKPSTIVKVTFEPNGGTGTINPVTFTPGQTVTAPNGDGFTRDGWTFAGWNTKADGSGIKISAGQSVTTPTSITSFVLYAQWTKNTTSTHTVTFDTDGGTPVYAQTVADKDKAKKPSTTRNGWTFDGWTLDGIPYDFDTPVTRDITLKATWVKNTTPTTTTKVGMSKTIAPMGKNNEYRLNLSVTGSGSSENGRTPTDYIVTVDESVSMRYIDSKGVTRMTYLKQSLKKLADAVLTSQNAARPADKQDRIAVFRTSEDLYASSTSLQPVTWFTKASDIENLTLDEKGEHGNTPWASWLLATSMQYRTARQNAQKVGIFITDGSPNAIYNDWRNGFENTDGAYDSDSGLKGSHNNAEYARSLVRTKDLAKEDWTAFYNIGIDYAYQKCDGTISSTPNSTPQMVCLTPKGVDMPADGSTSKGYGTYFYFPAEGKVKTRLASAEEFNRSDFESPLEGLTRKMVDNGMNAHLSTPDGSGLSDAVEAVTKDVSIIHTMRDAVITDPLSDWVDPVGLTDGKGTGITVTKDGKAMTSGYTAAYNAKARAVTVRFDGDLADGSVYAASFAVTPSEKAITDHRSGSAYPDTGDPDTGDTSAGKKGYVSNKDAVLSWNDVTTTNGVESSKAAHASYPHPVVQAPSIPIIEGLPNAGNGITLLTVLAPAGCLLSLLGLGAVLVYRRLYGE